MMTCPRCNSVDYYLTRLGNVMRCVECKADYSATSSTDLRGHKKPIHQIESALRFIADNPDCTLARARAAA